VRKHVNEEEYTAKVNDTGKKNPRSTTCRSRWRTTQDILSTEGVGPDYPCARRPTRVRHNSSSSTPLTVGVSETVCRFATDTTAGLEPPTPKGKGNEACDDLERLSQHSCATRGLRLGISSGWKDGHLFSIIPPHPYCQLFCCLGYKKPIHRGRPWPFNCTCPRRSLVSNTPRQCATIPSIDLVLSTSRS
jgi:hypothetical protein